jgi:hypothetical protein
MTTVFETAAPLPGGKDMAINFTFTPEPEPEPAPVAQAPEWDAPEWDYTDPIANAAWW